MKWINIGFLMSLVIVAGCQSSTKEKIQAGVDMTCAGANALAQTTQEITGDGATDAGTQAAAARATKLTASVCKAATAIANSVPVSSTAVASK
jgi:hypothetical protein